MAYKDIKFTWYWTVIAPDGTIEGERKQCYPIFGDDLFLNGEKEAENVFIRYKLTGNITFCRYDFEYFNTFDVERTFKLEVIINTLQGEQEFTFYFMRSDCEIDIDNMLSHVTIRAVDKYEYILNYMDNEYDILNLAPTISNPYFYIRPIQQIWLIKNGVPDQRVTNYLAGMYWEEDVVNENTDSTWLTARGWQYLDTGAAGTLAIWYRVLCPAGSGSARDYPNDDVVTNKRLYPNRINAQVTNNQFYYWTSTQEAPTKWGRSNNGRYWTKPPGGTGDAGRYYSIPIGRSSWTDASIWFNQYEWFDDELFALRQTRSANSVYILHAIQILLDAMGTNLLFSNTAEYSRFLFGENPIDDNIRFWLVPKSNIARADYDVPAQKGILKLSDILDYLKTVYKLYWFIDDENRLRIEHISFFKNGYSYPGESVASVGVDLTNIYNPRNKKSWSYRTNKITYDLDDLPKRYEPSWSRDCSPAFTGYPVEILSDYVNREVKEDKIITNIEADIDYIISQSQSESLDGWVMLTGTSSSSYTTFIQYYDYDNIRLTVQNYYNSLYYAIPKYWIYDLPSDRVKINDREFSGVLGVKKALKQTVEIPQAINIDDKKLVKTEYGDGQIENININLFSEIAETILSYPVKEI